MRFGRLSRNTLKPHCEPNSISMKGVGAWCAAFSEMGIESGTHFQLPGPDTRVDEKGLMKFERRGIEKFKAALLDAAGKARNEERSRREPPPSEQQ